MDQVEFARHVDDVMESENITWEEAIVIVAGCVAHHDS